MYSYHILEVVYLLGDFLVFTIYTYLYYMYIELCVYIYTQIRFGRYTMCDLPQARAPDNVDVVAKFVLFFVRICHQQSTINGLCLTDVIRVCELRMRPDMFLFTSLLGSA